ncbi:hypothetical protein HOY80DRAFT_952419 [Tuber brumale]|nr:hypothetical protein HOY80DRAFT_952419 [Tuber brumale]
MKRKPTGLATTVARFLLGWACAVTTWNKKQIIRIEHTHVAILWIARDELLAWVSSNSEPNLFGFGKNIRPQL